MIRTNVPKRTPILWINGPEAIGKSTVAIAILRQLSAKTSSGRAGSCPSSAIPGSVVHAARLPADG
jgi:hypothetical protein